MMHDSLLKKTVVMSFVNRTFYDLLCNSTGSSPLNSPFWDKGSPEFWPAMFFSIEDVEASSKGWCRFISKDLSGPQRPAAGGPADGAI